VRVVVVEKGRVEETVTNSRAGTVKARRRAKLAPEIGGKVLSLPRRRGAVVRRGDLLLRVDDALQRARLRLAEDEHKTAGAQREQACLLAERAGRDRERTRKLAQDGLVASDWDDRIESEAQQAAAACRAAASAVERAKSGVALSRAELDKTVLLAPFDGIVADTFIEEGEWTSPSPPALPIPPILDLIDTRSIYVSAPLDEVDSGRIRKGQTARVTVDSQPGKHFAARIVEVAPYVMDRLEQNRTLEIELELEDAQAAAALLPGTSADAEVILSAKDDVLRVPTQALLEGGKVLVLEGDRLVERTLEIGLRNWDMTEVKSGLAPGDRVVVSLDRPEIKAGARARVAEAARP
jgi:HlyD family secretion protein